MELLLTAEELRVLACLVEKSFTTPDQYPLTTNSLTNACNQKTSREPVVDYPSQLVDRTMLALRDAGWARSVRGAGNRAFKHKHVMDERLGVSEAEQAVLAVLALAGAAVGGGVVHTDGALRGVRRATATRRSPRWRKRWRPWLAGSHRWSATSAAPRANPRTAGSN